MNTLITELVVTEQCNLDCKYCYMKNNAVYMTLEGIQHYIDNVGKIMDIYGSQKYHISYFGGEPLLNWEVVKDAILLFNADPRCESQVIITNGYLLTQEIVDHCKRHNVAFSWSFDGKYQDKSRPHKIDKDSLSGYMDNKELLLSVSQSCKVMIDPSNIKTMVENFDFFVNEFQIYNPDYSLVRDDIWSDEDIETFKIESRKLADKIINYFHNNMNVSAGFYTLALMDMINSSIHSKRPFGCFAGCQGVGYFPSKEFYPCARFGSSKEFLLMDSEANLQHENIKTLLNPKIHDPRTYDKCQDCALYNYCNAGCTYSQLKINDDGFHIAEPVDSICELYHIIYNDAIYINDELMNYPMYKEYLNNILRPLGVKNV